MGTKNLLVTILTKTGLLYLSRNLEKNEILSVRSFYPNMKRITVVASEKNRPSHVKKVEKKIVKTCTG